jgi:hypothetical protein
MKKEEQGKKRLPFTSHKLHFHGELSRKVKSSPIKVSKCLNMAHRKCLYGGNNQKWVKVVDVG